MASPLAGSRKDDFQLTEDGKPTEIRYFSQGTELPLTLTLLMVDTSGSQRNLIVDETAASMIFFRTMLQTRSRIAPRWCSLIAASLSCSP